MRFVDRFKSAYQSVLMISIPKSTSLMIPSHLQLPSLSSSRHSTTTTTKQKRKKNSTPRTTNSPKKNHQHHQHPLQSSSTASLGQSQNAQMPIFPIRVRLSGNRIHDQFQIFSSHGMVKRDGARVEIYTVGDVVPYVREECGVPVGGCAGG